jgi:hypothetical protein
MNFKHIIFMITLVPCMSHAMDKKNDEPKKKDKPALQLDAPKSKGKSSPVIKHKPNTTPEATYLKDLLTPITFAKKTKSLYEWLSYHRNRKFGNTAVIEFVECNPNFINPSIVKNISEEALSSISEGKAVYYSNVRKASIQNNKYIRYGVIVVNQQQTSHDVMLNIHLLTDYLLYYMLLNQHMQPLSIENKTDDAQPEKSKSLMSTVD